MLIKIIHFVFFFAIPIGIWVALNIPYYNKAVQGIEDRLWRIEVRDKQ